MNISFYNNYFLNKEEKYFVKYIFIFLVLIIFIITILFIPYPNLKHVVGTVNKVDENYYVFLNIKSDDLEYINKFLYIDNKKYKYKVSKIESNNKNYYVLLKIDLPEKYLLNNYPINIKLIKDKISFGTKIKNKMKGWFISN